MAFGTDVMAFGKEDVKAFGKDVMGVW